MMCSLLAFLQAMAVFLSAWTLVVISFDRWMAIMFVLTPSIRITNRRALYLVCATWIFSILMALPLLFTTRSFEIQEGLENCGENWTYFGDAGEQVRKVYSSMVVILQYIVPQAVLIITYTHIGIKMWNSRVPGMHNGATKKMIVDRHESVKKVCDVELVLLSDSTDYRFLVTLKLKQLTTLENITSLERRNYSEAHIFGRTVFQTQGNNNNDEEQSFYSKNSLETVEVKLF
ncbi:unnamed protein product [Caenorhabditis brenneri]